VTDQSPAGNLPLFAKFPELASLPRAVLCRLPSPIERLNGLGRDLWIKRDDLNAPFCGGNKVRALEFLLGRIGHGDTVITVGGAGSTHVLATAIHSKRLGAGTVALRWKHDMNPVAETIDSRIASAIAGSPVHRTPLTAIATARYRAFSSGAHYLPVGGSLPLGILGHVNAALELAGQIEREEMPMPACVVLPLGTGGTVAGMLLGFMIAGLPVEIVAARVGPRLFSNSRKVLSLVSATSRLIERLTGEKIPRIDPWMLRVVHHVYGGAYGRPLPQANKAAKDLHDATGIQLDETYSAKAWVAALDESRAAKGPVLFWLTFDASCLTS
jgi:1-aminocyclopropane-1-carboxylate deaminase/D-cysteine desulfhydrase-like pyridoxal-dependent ACC family enzyme